MSTTSETNGARRAGATHNGRYKWIALSNTTLGILMATINQSIVLIAMPDIFRGIHLNPLVPSNTSYLLWMLLGFMVIAAVLVVSLGRVGDMFGRVRMYNLGFAIFTAGSILLSIVWMTGPSAALWLIGMRIVQGVGAAFLFANSSAILTDAFPADQRGLALGINMVAAIAGSFIGLVLGGVLAPISWRLVFLVSVPVGVFGTFWAYLKLEERGVRVKAKIDWLGNLTFAVGLIAVLVGITYGILPHGGHAMGWTNPWVLAAIVGGIVILALFVMIERRVEAPMFRLPLFKIRAFTAGNIASLLAALSRGGMMFMLIIWLQGIWLPEHGYSFTDTPLWAGIYLLPLSAGFLVAGPVVGAAGRSLRGTAVCDRRHDRRDDQLLPADRAARRLPVLGVRAGDRAQRPRDGPVRGAQPDRDHEQPAARPARRRRRNGRHVHERCGGAVDRDLLQPDHHRALLQPAAGPLPRPGVKRRTARLRGQGLAPAAGRHPVRRVLGLQPDGHAAGAGSAPAPAPHRGLPDRPQVLPDPGLTPVRSGIHEAFYFAAGCCVVAAIASWMRGGKYYHVESAEPELAPADLAATEAGGLTGTSVDIAALVGGDRE